MRRVTPRPRSTLLTAAVTVPLLLAACGGDDGGDDAAAGPDVRTIEITMVDIAYEPEAIEVEAGETVRFVFENEGEALHEAFIGEEADQAAHAEEMGGGEMDMGDHGDEAVEVEPGETEELTYTFEEAGSVQIGCHQPGHFEAGMVLDVTVG